MPNHITNILDVTGPAKDVQAFKEKIFRYEKNKQGEEVPVFDFETTVPMPKELDVESSNREEMASIYEENIKKFGHKDWYSWHCANWGTKWNAYDAGEPEDIEDGLRFRFDTAWSPPGEWLIATARLFPSLELRDAWIDEGGGAGILTLHGEDVEDENINDETWLMEFDPAYKEEYEFITEGNYDEVVKAYLEEEELRFGFLGTYLLNRLKDKDLPLFINFEFYDNEKFNTRLKEAGIKKEAISE